MERDGVERQVHLGPVVRPRSVHTRGAALLDQEVRELPLLSQSLQAVGRTKTELSVVGTLQSFGQFIKPQPSDQMPLALRKRGPEREANLKGLCIVRVLAQLDRGIPRVLDHLPCEQRGVR